EMSACRDKEPTPRAMGVGSVRCEHQLRSTSVRRHRRHLRHGGYDVLRGQRKLTTDETVAARSHAERLLLFERENMATLYALQVGAAPVALEAQVSVAVWACFQE